MSSETLLTDLCAICHVNSIKYTCPRCDIHTCSLPCVKKHKTWANCSGVRNPAEYRKRAELATPSSIDKDFNFITNVERSIARADENVLDRGLSIGPARHLRAIDARPKVDIEIEERGIRVIKAPKSLSRAKQNKTHWVNQQKSVMWTIEWICADGEKVTGSALELRTIGEAYTNGVGKKKAKRKRELGQHSQKLEPPLKAAKHADEQSNKQVLAGEETGSQNVPSVGDPSSGGPGKASELDGVYFYLHNPATPSKYKCLVPLPATQTLRTTLEGQVVLEYPTIYALNKSPDLLQAPFITQNEYWDRHGADIQDKVAVSLEDGEVDEPSVPTLPTAVDSTKVFEVLAQDLAG